MLTCLSPTKPHQPIATHKQLGVIHVAKRMQIALIGLDDTARCEFVKQLENCIAGMDILTFADYNEFAGFMNNSPPINLTGIGISLPIVSSVLIEQLKILVNPRAPKIFIFPFSKENECLLNQISDGVQESSRPTPLDLVSDMSYPDPTEEGTIFRKPKEYPHLAVQPIKRGKSGRSGWYRPR